MSVTFENSLVAIVRSQGVSIAYPSTMTRAELACVLHGLAGTLFQEIAGSGERAALPEQKLDTSRFAGLEVVGPGEPQSPQGVNRRTKSDRRGLPRKKVVKRSRNGKTETLECGHVISPIPSNWKLHKSRACEQCAAAQAAL